MLIIDNYDSFTYNIVQYIKILGIEPIVIKNDELSLNEIKNLNNNFFLKIPTTVFECISIHPLEKLLFLLLHFSLG